MQKWQSQLENRVSSFREAYSMFGEIIFFEYEYRDHEGLQKLPISKLGLVQMTTYVLKDT